MKKACLTKRERKAWNKKRNAKPETRKQIQTIQQRNIDEAKYKCANCNKCFSAPTKLKLHYNTKIHKAIITQQAIDELQNLTNQQLYY